MEIDRLPDNYTELGRLPQSSSVESEKGDGERWTPRTVFCFLSRVERCECVCVGVNCTEFLRGVWTEWKTRE